MRKYVVRYGAMRALGIVEVEDANADVFYRGSQALARTRRGLEVVATLIETTDAKLASASLSSAEKLTFVRALNASDKARLSEIESNEKADYNRCLKVIERLGVEMRLSRVERIFGGELVVVYYVADGRVDFRELVRALAAEFQTRIEMKQIGARDETKLLADVGDCGREVCCNTYLASTPAVSMKMAKLQKATLDPTKISGRCGRLKCCLRYEYESYNDASDKTPPIGRRVETPAGYGTVRAQELSARRVAVELDDGRRKSFAVEELRVSCSRRRRRGGCDEDERDD